MKKKRATLSVMAFWAMLSVTSACSSNNSISLIINHTCTNLLLIPMEWIDSVQANYRLHYAHTSHGSQLTTGLKRIENTDSRYNVNIAHSSLPSEPGAFCIFDGQEGDNYITPEEYWQTTEGMNMTRNVLNHNPTINVSMWSWCCQVNHYSEDETQAYLDSMTVLETEYPNVIFIYMTGNAQGTGADGYNRYLRNEQIRQYCRDHSKVLFDFADLDSWWFNPTTKEWEHATYEYSGHAVPVEHPQFHGSEAGHTTYESCEQKGKAVWWMMAKLAGWAGSMSVTENNSTVSRIAILSQNYPNPFGFSTSIRYVLQKKCNIELTVYNLEGQLVRTLIKEKKKAGVHTVVWNGKDNKGTELPSGIYFYQLRTPGKLKKVRKMIIF